VLYLCQSRTAPFNSDGAANVLQGQAIVTGNPLLSGWWTSDVSFYTTELPEYALVTAIRGLSPDVAHLCGALTYTLTVLLAALVARGGTGASTGGRAGWCRAGVATGIMLAPSLLGGTEVFLENPDHAGTAVPVLLLLLLSQAAIKSDPPDGTGAPGVTRWGGWLVPAGACALLALAQAGDELTLVAATVPLAVVSTAEILAFLSGTPRWAPAVAPGENTQVQESPGSFGPRGAGRYNGGFCHRPAARGHRGVRGVAPPGDSCALLAAAAVSVGLARLAYVMIRGLGGFDLRPLGGVALAPLTQAPANASLLWRSLILLFGANNPGTPHEAQTIRAHAFLVGMADLHVIGLLLAGVGLAAGIAQLLSRHADRVTQLLVVSVIALLAAGVFTTVLRSLSNAHEVAILLPLGAALAGRVLPSLAGRLLPAGLPPARLRFASLPVPAFPPRPSGRPPGPGAAPRHRASIADLALGAWLAVSLAELCYAAAWPATPPPQQAVAAWLAGHHEREGLAGYWQADATTVTSGGQVLVAPITLPATARAAQATTEVEGVGSAFRGRARVEGIPSFRRNHARQNPAHPTAPAQATQAQPGHARESGQAAAEVDRWESSAAWYQPGQRDATFVIAVTGPGAPGGLSPEAVRARFGPPAAEHQVGQDVIMLYGYNLLIRLTSATFPGPG